MTKEPRVLMSDKTISVTVVMDADGIDPNRERAVITDAIAALTMYANTLPEPKHQNWVKGIYVE